MSQHTPDDYESVREEITDLIVLHGVRDRQVLFARALDYNAMYECRVKRPLLHDMVDAALLLADVVTA